MKRIMKTIAMAAVMMSALIVNSACWFKVYQEELPETFNRLKNSR